MTSHARALDVAKSEAAFYAKTLIGLRQTLTFVREGMEDEGGRIYFGSTNHADDLTAIIEKIEGLEWDKILSSSQPPVDLYALLAEQRARAETAEDEREEWRQACMQAREGCNQRSEVISKLHGKIEALSARLQEAEKALEPFAKAADIKLCGDWRDDQYFGQTDVGFHLTFGDLRRARSALKEMTDGQ